MFVRHFRLLHPMIYRSDGRAITRIHQSSSDPRPLLYCWTAFNWSTDMINRSPPPPPPPPNFPVFRDYGSKSKVKTYPKLGQNALASTGSILSNTDLSDLSTVGTCDIFVYQMRQRVMWFARLADSILFIKRVITCHWNGFFENAMRRMFSKMFSAYNMISLWQSTVIPIIVMIWLPKITRYLHWRII